MTEHHYTGLTAAEVAESRSRHGQNILTPPQEETLWSRVCNCRHYSLVVLSFSAAVLVALGLGVAAWAGVSLPHGVWIAPVILLVLCALSYLVAFFGGKYDKVNHRFEMDPLITILLVALLLSAAISFYQGVWGGKTGITPYFEPIGIAIAVLLATSVGYILERQNEKTFRSLNEVNDDTPVKVIRDSNVQEVPRREVVVGDIILLETGEEVPADAELLEAMNLVLNESSLTGEPQCSKTIDPTQFDPDATYPSNQVMKGCTVLEGDCTARVFAVGDHTACGKVFRAAQVRDDGDTPLTQNLKQLAGVITKVSYAIAALVLIGRVLAYFAAGHTALDVDMVKYLLDSVMIAVTLIVVATPEGLPMAVTLSLAFSMKRLMKQNTLPRTMHACETMGAVSVICTDKTGTLTQNQMRVQTTEFVGLAGQRLSQDPVSERIEECIVANSTANLDYSDPNHIRTIGNPTEGALLLWLHDQGVSYAPLREQIEIVERLSFSTERKFMATRVLSRLTGRQVVYVKGAPDVLLDYCNLTADEFIEYSALLAQYQAKALRTLAFACIESEQALSLEQIVRGGGLTWIGVVAIADPIRADVPAAIRECTEAGIRVKIVTGDAPGTAKEIGRQLGLWSDNDTERNILLGTELAAMTDEQLMERLPDVKIISRARPNDKERAVRLLRKLGEVVAVTGDGTNDAPALNAANVGLSMGDGTAVAKEASDMTIMDNSFATIANAVMWGRSLYKNIKRFILFQMVVNVTACLTVAIGAFTGTDSPLTVTQMLWVNLIMDTFAALALASLPPTHSVMRDRPRPQNEPLLRGIGGQIVAIGLIFTALMMSLLVLLEHTATISFTDLSFAFGAQNGLTPYELGLFFTFFVFLQFWNLFNAKAFMTNRSAFHGLSWQNTKWFLLIAGIIFVGQLLVVEMPGLQVMFNVAEGGLRWQDWLIIIASTSLVLWVGELIRLVRRLLSRSC